MGGPLTADDVVAQLKLAPHPEGGWYRETFRDDPGHKGRPHSTAILFLLNEISRWHRVDAAELWHWYGGATSFSTSGMEQRAMFTRLLTPASLCASRPPRNALQMLVTSSGF